MTKTPSQPWPWNKLPKPTPADWGFGMTVCVAGYSCPDDSIVCVTDMMVSLGDLSMSADFSAIKVIDINKHWLGMLAGDVSVWPDVKWHFEQWLANNREIDFDKVSEIELADGLRSAFESEARKRAEAEILSPYGLTLDNYRDEGPKLGPDTFSRIVFTLGEKTLDFKMMLAGFKGRTGHIFTVEKRGTVEHVHGTGAWAIGSGQLAALGSLFAAQINPLKTLQRIFFDCCCAKFAAEMAPGVGKATIAYVVQSDGSRRLFTDPLLEPIRKRWEKMQRGNSDAAINKVVEDVLDAGYSEDPKRRKTTKPQHKARQAGQQ